LSVINAIAGAYSENLPLICIVGGPNSNDYGTNRILHHTIGIPDFSQELRCFQTVTCFQVGTNLVVYFSVWFDFFFMLILFCCINCVYEVDNDELVL
jgi:pyruvate decarboxylase